MAIDLRIKALARLAESNTDAANTALLAELDGAAATLKTSSEYQKLFQSLEVLDAIGYRFSELTVACIESFVQTIETRKLTYSLAHEAFADYIAKYSNAQSLIVKAVEIVTRLRYHQTRRVLSILLSLYGHSSEAVRKKVGSGLGSLAKYDLDVFYGVDRKGGFGPAPQKVVLEVLEALDVAELKKHYEAALQLLGGMLTPILEGVSWTSNAVTISQGVIPPLSSVSEVRARSIRLLRRLYFLAGSKQQKLAAINSLSEGTRTDNRAATDSTTAMIARDSTEILTFFADLVPSEDFQIVQKIESNSYWIFAHAPSDEARSAALNVEKAVNANSEYSIYRTLVGFEGIFGEWSTYESVSQQFERIEKERREKASAFARSITEKNYPQWRARILEYAKTESDDLATFPVFYHFLSEFAAAQPKLAHKLISEDTDAIARFLIPILSSLWNGNQRKHARKLIETWIKEAKPELHPHLFATARMFLSTKELDVQLLRRLLEKAGQIKDVATVRQIAAVAIARWQNAEDISSKLLFPALDVLTEMGDARWIFEVWFRKEARTLFARIDSHGVELVLRNLRSLDKIDFHAEEVLYGLAQQKPERVLQFMIDRMAIERQRRSKNDERSFEAIPFEFHKLQEPLSEIPGTAVRTLLEQYRIEPTLFAFRGGRLLKNIFPKFPQQFETQLLQLVREGGEGNLEFVLAVLRNYQGEPFLHPLIKEIVKSLDSESSLLNEVSIVLTTTGVVSGEFGMSEAYERKRQEMSHWLSDPNEKVKAFAARHMADLEQMRDEETKRAAEDIALRKHRFRE